MKKLDGSSLKLADLKGKAVLLVNVASACGYTPQYTGLQKLHEQYAGKGLVVLGVPCNDFGKQEPGTADEIQTFCSTKFSVTFPLTEKVAILGDGKCELYKLLTTAKAPGIEPGDVKWNFEKFLVGKDGKVIGRFPSKVAPDAPELKTAIDKALA
jgi:glutathione peroxidase